MIGTGIFGDMGILWATIIMITAIIGLMMAGVPIAYVSGALAIFFSVCYLGPHTLPLIGTRVYSLANDYVLIAIPMFVFMAAVLDESGIASDLYDALHAWAGGIQGGVAISTLIAALFLAAMSGIIGGEIVLLGMIALPQMVRVGYDRKLAIGVVCAGGSLGTMMPPSVVLIVYGLTTRTPISALFMGAIIPALVLCSLYILYVVIRLKLNPSMGPSREDATQYTFAEKLKLAKGLIIPLVLIFAVLGTIYTGIASITEAAALGAFGSVLAAAFRRDLSISMLKKVISTTLVNCGSILFIALGATALIGIYNIMGGYRFIEEILFGTGLPPMGIIILMMSILLVLGMFMDWIGIVFLTMPVFVPIVVKMGFDPIWFGVLFCMNMQVSYLSPPFGNAAFILKGVVPPDVKLGEIFSAFLPFIALQLVSLVLNILFPQMSLILPKAMGLY